MTKCPCLYFSFGAITVDPWPFQPLNLCTSWWTIVQRWCFSHHHPPPFLPVLRNGSIGFFFLCFKSVFGHMANLTLHCTLLLYKIQHTPFLFAPDDPPPYKDGVRINSPHYLCKLVENKGTTSYTLVISQYSKNNTIHYTLRVYATCEILLTKIKDPFNEKYSKRVSPHCH